MRLQSALLMGCSAIALAACGGEQQQADRTTDVGPSIPNDVAARLADRSDKVAARLEAGDECNARKEAAALRADLNASLGEIPELYLEDLSGLVNEIEAQIPVCAQLPPPIRSERKKGKKGKKDREKHGEDEGDD